MVVKLKDRKKKKPGNILKPQAKNAGSFTVIGKWVPGKEIAGKINYSNPAVAKPKNLCCLEK